MYAQLLQTLVHSSNEAADDLLLEALRVGGEVEQSFVLDALMERQTLRGLNGVVGQFSDLPAKIQTRILGKAKLLYAALRECARSSSYQLRIAAIKLIAKGRQGKLAYLLTDNLQDESEELSEPAVQGLMELAVWIAETSNKLRTLPAGAQIPEELRKAHAQICEHRMEIESSVARALEIHRGKYVTELVQAALLLSDWTGSKALSVLQTPKHGGQGPLVRRLQDVPNAELVPAFFFSATHCGMRNQFGTVFSHIADGRVLDEILRRTHWLKEHNLQICMHQVTRGQWFQDGDLVKDLERLSPLQASQIGEWVGGSGLHDVAQDERLIRLKAKCKSEMGGRLRLLRVAMRRKKGASVQFLREMLGDSDERLMRMAAREIIRRRPLDYENVLLQMMTNAPPSVRRVISRSIGQTGFESFWQRFDHLDPHTRRQAGKAMMKLLPDTVQMLSRRMNSGTVEQQVKAMQMAQELGLGEQVSDVLGQLVASPNAKLRSKAVTVLGELNSMPAGPMLEKVLNDPDARVRANAIEVLESKPAAQYVPLLAARAKSSHSRERANAIKALHQMNVGNIGPTLLAMLRDNRADHRISAMWALRRMGWWALLQEVSRMAKEDQNIRVRRYAIALLNIVAGMSKAGEGKVG